MIQSAHLILTIAPVDPPGRLEKFLAVVTAVDKKTARVAQVDELGRTEAEAAERAIRAVVERMYK